MSTAADPPPIGGAPGDAAPIAGFDSNSAKRIRVMARVAGGLLAFRAVAIVESTVTNPDGPDRRALVWIALLTVGAVLFLRGRRQFRVPAIVLTWLGIVGPIASLAKWAHASRAIVFLAIFDVAGVVLLAAAVTTLLVGAGTKGRLSLGLVFGSLHVMVAVALYLIFRSVL